MVTIVPPYENGAFGGNRQPGRSDGQHSGDRRPVSDSEKTQPVASTVGVSVRLSEAVRASSGGAASVRGGSAAGDARENLSGAAADLDRKAGSSGSAAKALETKREALALALVSGDPGEVAKAARSFVEAKAEAKKESAGFQFRASRVVEEPTVVYDSESGRYVQSTRRVALSVEQDPGKLLVDANDLQAGADGVSIIHKDPPVPLGTPIPQPASIAEE